MIDCHCYVYHKIKFCLQGSWCIVRLTGSDFYIFTPLDIREFFLVIMIEYSGLTCHNKKEFLKSIFAMFHFVSRKFRITTLPDNAIKIDSCSCDYETVLTNLLNGPEYSAVSILLEYRCIQVLFGKISKRLEKYTGKLLFYRNHLCDLSRPFKIFENRLIITRVRIYSEFNIG